MVSLMLLNFISHSNPHYISYTSSTQGNRKQAQKSSYRIYKIRIAIQNSLEVAVPLLNKLNNHGMQLNLWT